MEMLRVQGLDLTNPSHAPLLMVMVIGKRWYSVLNYRRSGPFTCFLLGLEG